MKEKLYIPKKIKVGFRSRADTYTGKLGYIIYYDDKNVLRKEKSWNSWRDKEIEPVEFDNVPFEGFVINKDIQRYNWSHFSSNRSYIRLYDSRDFEFEITPENLMGILMNGDCSRRVLDGKFVYAWHGTDLVLLPCNSEEYIAASNFTKLQAKKISTKALIPGHVYLTKRQREVMYMGRFDWYSFVDEDNAKIPKYSRGGERTYTQRGKKEHIFATKIDEPFAFESKSSADFIAECISDEVSENYASAMDALAKHPKTSKVVDVKINSRSLSLEELLASKAYLGYHKETDIFFRDSFGIHVGHIRPTTKWVVPAPDKPSGGYVTIEDAFEVNIYSEAMQLSVEDGVFKYKYKYNQRTPAHNYRIFDRSMNKEQIDKLDIVQVQLVRENGTTINVSAGSYWVGELS